jgi:Novel toxin 10
MTTDNYAPPGGAAWTALPSEATEGLDAAGIAGQWGIPESPTGFQVIRFATPDEGLASPVFRTNPGFVGRGFSSGGAPEFVIPNGPIPPGAMITVVPP